MSDRLTVKIQTQDILKEIEEFQEVILHYKALHHLFEAIRSIVSEDEYNLLTKTYDEALDKLRE